MDGAREYDPDDAADQAERQSRLRVGRRAGHMRVTLEYLFLCVSAPRRRNKPI